MSRSHHHSRRKGSATSDLNHVPVEFETVLRIRPLSKKEREDPIVLEKQLASQQHPHNNSHNHNHHAYHSVALHPLPRKEQGLLSPSSALVKQTLASPDAGAGSVLLQQQQTQLQHDVEFQLDHVLSPDSDQEKVYYSLGLPKALSIMESLKADLASNSRSSSSSRSNKLKKTHLIVAMGLTAAGKTFTTTGATACISKRKADTDGLIPRLMDSLYSQSQHNMNVKSAGLQFGVNVCIIQVNQSTKKPDDVQYHDLLQQPVSSSASSSFSRSSGQALSAVRGMVATSITGGSNNSSSGSLSAPTSLRSTATSNSNNSSSSSNHYSSLDEPVSVQQDNDSPDFYTVNAQVRTCKSAEQARETLHTAAQHSRKLTNARRMQSHVLVKLQPVLLDRQGRIVQQGGTVAVLDMAAADVKNGSHGVRGNNNKRMKDAIPANRDAHTAIFHCLRTLQHNQRTMSGESHPVSAKVGSAAAAAVDTDSEFEDSLAYGGAIAGNYRDNKPGYARQVSLRKVPYRQHKLTMLLQPLFSPKHTDHTVVTLLVAVSPSYRDYSEKKTLLNDVEGFRGALPAVGVTTGLKPVAATVVHRKKERPNRERKKKVCPLAASDADDEGSINRARRRGKSVPNNEILADCGSPTVPSLIHSVPSMTYSDDDDDDNAELVPLPPPMAPSYHLANAAPTHNISSVYTNVLSPAASLPLQVIPSYSSKPQVAVLDFPGVVIPTNDRAHYSESPNQGSVASYKPRLVKKQAAVVPTVAKSRVVSTAPCEAMPLRTASIPNSNSHNNVMFSPMKAINKVVSVSKKKGKKVMDKMTLMDPRSLSAVKPSAPTDSSTDASASVDPNVLVRLQQLELKNAELRLENEKLRGDNTKLLLENQELRMHESDKNESTSTRSDDSVSLQGLSMQEADDENQPPSPAPAPAPSLSPSLPEYKMQPAIHASNYAATNSNRNRIESFSDDSRDDKHDDWSRRQQTKSSGIMDDSLFQHMAQLSGQSTSPWTAPVASSTPNTDNGRQGHFSLQVPSDYYSGR